MKRPRRLNTSRTRTFIAKSIYLSVKRCGSRSITFTTVATLLIVKAVVITRLGGPEVLEVRDVPDPIPGGGEELVRVEAAGVNFADTMAASGGYPGTPKPPVVAGREFCGTRVSNGERVMGYAQWGAFAELIAARTALLWPVPAGWIAEEGAAFPVNFFTAYFAH